MSNAIETLDGLRGQLRDAEARVVELEGERAKARRAVAKAQGPLSEYWESVGAGERDHDGEVERELAAAVKRAEGVTTLEPVMADGRVAGLEVRDIRVEALLAGARRAVEDRRAEVAQFAAGHLVDLAAERLPRARRIGEQVHAVLATVDPARHAWTEETRWWAELFRLAGRGELLDELPHNPVPGVELTSARMPAPASLAGEEPA